MRAGEGSDAWVSAPAALPALLAEMNVVSLRSRLRSMAEDARKRAEEATTVGEAFNDSIAKQMMRDVARDYAALADRLEKIVEERW